MARSGVQRGVALVGTLTALAIPASASANVYCVDVSGGDCTTIESPGGATGFSQAITDADAHSGADTIRLGNTTYTTPSPGGFAALSSGALSIAGSGQDPGHTVISVPAPLTAPTGPGLVTYKGLSLPSSSGSTVSDLSIVLPTPPAPLDFQLYVGIFSAGVTTVSRVTIMGPAAPMQTRAIGMQLRFAADTVTDSTIDLPLLGADFTTGIAIDQTAGPRTIERTSITADEGVGFEAGASDTLAIGHSTLRTDRTGLDVRHGSAQLQDSVIDVEQGTSSSAAGVVAGSRSLSDGAGSATAALEGVTIGGAGANSTGVLALADDTGATDDTTMTMNNSAIAFTLNRSIDREAHDGDTANLTTDYSNFDQSASFDDGTGGFGATTLGSHLTEIVNPGFVNAAAGDFHLLPSSGLIDIGDPAVPTIGATDRDGSARGLSSTPACSLSPGRRDIGAYEFVPAAPSSCNPPPAAAIAAAPTIAAAPKKCKKHRKLRRGKCVKKKRKQK